MSLLEDVHSALSRLAPRGWSALLARHGLDITVPVNRLADELARPLAIDRTLAGFEEFALDGTRAVEPGIPGRSLLYHALASADVHPMQPRRSEQDYPTLEELDAVENYVYGMAKPRLSAFSNPVLAVMAYQYREKAMSPHRRHADLCFSRTGVARVGTEAARYLAESRCFDPRPMSGDRGFAVQPARYALFIAEYRAPTAADRVQRPVASDTQQIFLFPVHKVFAGSECIWNEDGRAIPISALQFAEFHINEKLRRLHTLQQDNPGAVAPLSVFDIGKTPFVRTTRTAKDLVELRPAGSSWLTIPVPGVIARTASQHVGGTDQIARFVVPAQSAQNRFWTSLELSSTARGRAAPEYANMRQEVVADPHGGTMIVDLNLVPNGGTPADQRFDAKLRDGGFEAAHFVDGTCDGVISCTTPAPLEPLMMFPAYSLVSAIDYFPNVEQVEILEWIEAQSGAPVGLSDTGSHFPSGGPQPLSDGRFVPGQPAVKTNRIPNQGLRDPANATVGPAFPPSEAASRSAAAIVGRAATAGSGERAGPGTFATTWLPDAASDVFAPGWDTSAHTVGANSTYTTYGLGSPFPEDAKLCAALNSFWPAAAPDSSRTYGFHPRQNRLLHTSIPLTNGELGYNAQHPRVLAGEVVARRGWDGDTGPFLSQHNGKRWVNASNVDRADKTRAAFDNQIGFSGLENVSTHGLIARMEALRFCRKHLLPQQPAVLDFWLVGVESVENWSTWSSTVHPALSSALSGAGLVLEFARVEPTRHPRGDPPLRIEFEVVTSIEVHLDATQAFTSAGAGGPQRTART